MIDNSTKQVCIVYCPGYAGNFLVRLFSLTDDTVPQLYKTELTNPNIQNLSAAERYEKYKFSQVLTENKTWQEFHRKWADLYDYADILPLLQPGDFKYMMFAMHEVEYRIFEDGKDIDPQSGRVNKYIDRLENDRIEFGVQLNLDKYQNWINNAKRKLKFKYRLEEKHFYNKFINALSNDMIIDLTKMLDSTAGFCEEYTRICNILEIIPDINNASLLYHDWYETRVKCFL